MPSTAEEARRIYGEATRHAATRSFHVVIDTSGHPDAHRLDPLLTLLGPGKAGG